MVLCEEKNTGTAAGYILIIYYVSIIYIPVYKKSNTAHTYKYNVLINRNGKFNNTVEMWYNIQYVFSILVPCYNFVKLL